MATLTMTAAGWPLRRRLFVAYNVAVFTVAVVVTVSQLGQVGQQAARHPQLWMMTALAVFAGTQAFIATVPPSGVPMIICPTMCFTFAILLCWGLGPAIVAQLAAVVAVAWRLRRPAREAVVPAGQYTLSFAAASLVLWVGNPDPFQRNGPTNVVTDAIAVVGAVGAWLVTYGLLALVVTRLRGHGPRARQAAGAVGNQILFNAALLVLSPVLAVAAHINVGFVPLVFVPLYAVQRMARLSADRDRAAQVDPLTDLANRTRLKTAFDELAASCAGGPEPQPRQRPTLLMLDLDRFKHVNDALGHDVGDQLLIAVAARLAALQPDGGIVARLGGDEFAILTTTTHPAQAHRLARAVVQALREPVRLDGLRLDVTASVGIAIHTDEHEDFATLMRYADVAMYEAKQRRDAIAVYKARADDSSPVRLGLLTDFRNALETNDRDQVTIHYQPQVSLTNGHVEGVEALLRWRHPTHGPINTQDLLTLAEHSSVMHLLTARVIDDVVAQVAAWTADGITLRASINVSARDLYSDDIVSHLSTQLSRHHVHPGQIQVEITESALLADPSRAHASVAGIAALGVAVALDDFGTGYSSLQHLRKMPITEIKIDQSFVAGMADNHDDAAIVRSTIDLANSLGIRTVAEGVETEYTRQLLTDAGATLAQGWLTARPMPAADLTNWLTHHTRPQPATSQP